MFTAACILIVMAFLSILWGVGVMAYDTWVDPVSWETIEFTDLVVKFGGSLNIAGIILLLGSAL